MLIATTLRVMGLQVHLDVPPEMHRGDIKVAMLDAERAARALAIMVERGQPCVVNPIMQGTKDREGNMLECRP